MGQAMLKQPTRQRLRVILCHAGLKPSEVEGVLEELFDTITDDEGLHHLCRARLEAIRRGE